MKKQLLFHSNFNSYWWDGTTYYERDEFHGTGKEKPVSRKRVLETATINNALRFMPLNCVNCGRETMLAKNFQYECNRCGHIQKAKMRTDRWEAQADPRNSTVIISVDGIPRVSLMQEIVIHGLDNCDPVQVKEELLLGYFDILEELNIL